MQPLSTKISSIENSKMPFDRLCIIAVPQTLGNRNQNGPIFFRKCSQANRISSCSPSRQSSRPSRSRKSSPPSNGRKANNLPQPGATKGPEKNISGILACRPSQSRVVVRASPGHDAQNKTPVFGESGQTGKPTVSCRLSLGLGLAPPGRGLGKPGFV